MEPDPLEPGYIPGQNPATPQRMPGHTSGASSHRAIAPWMLAGLCVAIAVLFLLGVLGH